MRLFEKISWLQAEKDGLTFDEWADLNLPQRATINSAGYDFCTPKQLYINPGQTVIVPSGIRCSMEDDEALLLYIRSSLGIKKNVRLSNSVGLVDQDYYHAANEGHIQIALHNDGSKAVILQKGERVMQGVFQKYLITDNDRVTQTRTGGVGSTGK